MRKDELDMNLDDFLQELELAPEGKMEDLLICECHVISLFHLRDLANVSGKYDLEYLKTETGLGSGCGSCLKGCENWLRKIVKTDT